jgi:hypothetical protein
MKKFFTSAVTIVIVGFAIIQSCKKEKFTPGNRTPMAQAGIDIIITLPEDSAMLDGTASNDLDGAITSYQWSKISRPASYNFRNPNGSKSMVNSLLAGTYKFEEHC